jgi:hypothetical protein
MAHLPLGQYAGDILEDLRRGKSRCVNDAQPTWQSFLFELTASRESHSVVIRYDTQSSSLFNSHVKRRVRIRRAPSLQRMRRIDSAAHRLNLSHELLVNSGGVEVYLAWLATERRDKDAR